MTIKYAFLIVLLLSQMGCATMLQSTALILQGTGQGMMAANKNNRNCTTTFEGSTAYTHCN